MSVSLNRLVTWNTTNSMQFFSSWGFTDHHIIIINPVTDDDDDDEVGGYK